MTDDTPTNPGTFAKGTFIDQDGGVWLITNYFDIEGNECDADDAFTAVAGANNTWFSFEIADMERPSVQ